MNLDELILKGLLNSLQELNTSADYDDHITSEIRDANINALENMFRGMGINTSDLPENDYGRGFDVDASLKYIKEEIGIAEQKVDEDLVKTIQELEDRKSHYLFELNEEALRNEKLNEENVRLIQENDVFEERLKHHKIAIASLEATIEELRTDIDENS